MVLGNYPVGSFKVNIHVHYPTDEILYPMDVFQVGGLYSLSGTFFYCHSNAGLALFVPVRSIVPVRNQDILFRAFQHSPSITSIGVVLAVYLFQGQVWADIEPRVSATFFIFASLGSK